MYVGSAVSQLINLRRLAAGFAVLAILLLPAYVFLLRDDGDATTRPPALVETPASAAATRIGLEAGELAPDFEISTTDGRRVRLSDFRGRAVVLNFWALWCTSCLTEMPEIKAALEERGLDSFAVLAVNAGESKKRALEFVDFLDAPFTYALDTNLAVSDAYRVRGLPATVFIDANGVIQTVYAGYTGQERFTAYLDAAIDARPPGDLPVVLRMISTIPRDRVLVVESRGERSIRLTSRSLRCDTAYCADAVASQLRAFAGIEEVETDHDAANPSITVRFDPAVIDRGRVVGAVTEAIEALLDPVYEGPVTVVEG